VKCCFRRELVVCMFFFLLLAYVDGGTRILRGPRISGERAVLQNGIGEVVAVEIKARR
jgi:hypothetical protein